ncbi:MAG: hypothetical protein OXH05_07795 [Acidobacteria bacterium]|nr:hypothetical protein [Acidobacteriota bacterium]
MTTSSNNAPPVDELRVGTCRAAIWRNEADGNTFHTATFSRLYRTEDGWRSRSSFGINDLPHLALLAQDTHRALAELNAVEEAPANE